MKTEPNLKYYCYVLWSASGRRFYIGVTSNIDQRLAQHNAGESKWTKRYMGSWELVWHEKRLSLGEARKMENRLKKQKGGQGFWALTGLQKSNYTGS